MLFPLKCICEVALFTICGNVIILILKKLVPILYASIGYRDRMKLRKMLFWGWLAFSIYAAFSDSVHEIAISRRAITARRSVLCCIYAMRLQPLILAVVWYYYKDRSVREFWHFMSDAEIVLVKVAALQEWCRTDQLLPRRQLLRPGEFLGPLSLSSRRSKRFIISHAWLSAEHPDPNGTQLRDMVSVLEQIGAKPDDLVFYDYCCLFQEDKGDPEWTQTLFEKQPGHRSLRTQEQHTLFTKAMDNMQLLYTSEDNHVVVIPEVPEDAANGTPYITRGWCFFELCVSADYDRTVVSSQSVEALMTAGKLPISPDQFQEDFRFKAFTNNGDRELVVNMFCKLHWHSALQLTISWSFEVWWGFWSIVGWLTILIDLGVSSI